LVVGTAICGTDVGKVQDVRNYIKWFIEKDTADKEDAV
jgi:hypothetical protein